MILGGNMVWFSCGIIGGFSIKGIIKVFVNVKKWLLGVLVVGNVCVDLCYEKGCEVVVFMLYFVYVVELFIGMEKCYCGCIGVGCFFGVKLFKCCCMGVNVDVNLYEYECMDVIGIMVCILCWMVVKDVEVCVLFLCVIDFMFLVVDVWCCLFEGMFDVDVFFYVFVSEFYVEYDFLFSWIN